MGKELVAAKMGEEHFIRFIDENTPWPCLVFTDRSAMVDWLKARDLLSEEVDTQIAMESIRHLFDPKRAFAYLIGRSDQVCVPIEDDTNLEAWTMKSVKANLISYHHVEGFIPAVEFVNRIWAERMNNKAAKPVVAPPSHHCEPKKPILSKNCSNTTSVCSATHNESTSTGQTEKQGAHHSQTASKETVQTKSVVSSDAEMRVESTLQEKGVIPSSQDDKSAAFFHTQPDLRTIDSYSSTDESEHLDNLCPLQKSSDGIVGSPMSINISAHHSHSPLSMTSPCSTKCSSDGLEFLTQNVITSGKFGSRRTLAMSDTDEDIKSIESLRSVKKESPVQTATDTGSKHRMSNLEFAARTMTNSAAWKVLTKYKCYKKNNKFCCPWSSSTDLKQSAFDSIEDVRDDLCRYGLDVTISCPKDCEKLKYWIRTNIVKKFDLSASKHEYEALDSSTFRTVLHKMGFEEKSDDNLVHPDIESGKKLILYENLQNYLALTGLPESCYNKAGVPDTQVLGALLWLTDARQVETFKRDINAPDKFYKSYQESLMVVSPRRKGSRLQHVGDFSGASSMSTSSTRRKGKKAAKSSTQKSNSVQESVYKQKETDVDENKVHQTCNIDNSLYDIMLSQLNYTDAVLPDRKEVIHNLSNESTLDDAMTLSINALQVGFMRDNLIFTNESPFGLNMSKVYNFLLHCTSSERNYFVHEKITKALYICGSPGIGKTKGVLWCCDEAAKLRNIDKPGSVRVCHLNAHSIDSYNEFCKLLGKAIGKTGNSVTNIIQTLKADPSKDDKTVVLVLDEIDYLLRRNSALEELMLHTNKEDSRLVLIGISNLTGERIYQELQKGGKFHQKITFQPYNVNELKMIITTLVAGGIVDNSAIGIIAKKVAGRSGDLRQAFALVSASIALCRSLLSDECLTRPYFKCQATVSVPYVMKAIKNSRNKISSLIDDLPTMIKSALCILSVLPKHDVREITLHCLRKGIEECLLQSKKSEDILQQGDFNVMIDNLKDSKLVNLVASKSEGQLTKSRDSNFLSKLDDTLIVLGDTIDEVEEYFTDLAEKQEYFRSLEIFAVDHIGMFTE